MPYQLNAHAGYVEVRLEGVIDRPVRLTGPEFESVRSAHRVLFDYSGITEMRADAYDLADAAKTCEVLGLKVAVYAPRPALFGLARQAIQLGGVAEGVSASVFLDHEAAREWLLAS